MAERPTKEIKKKSLAADVTGELIKGSVAVKNNKKVNIMLRLDEEFGQRVKEKAAEMRLPATKYIEQLILSDLEK